MIYSAIKFLIFLFRIIIGAACVLLGVITVGAFIAAIVSVFPAVGIILGIIVLSVVVYKIVVFVKDKKEEKLFREAEENCRNKLKKETDKYRLY